MTQARERLSNWVIAGYATGSIGTGLFSTVPSVLLLFYMTDTLVIPAGLAAFAVFVPKIWGLVSDPVVGALSDRTHSPWGRRRPWLLAGAILLAPALFFLFKTPSVEGVFPRFVWVIGVYALCATAYSVFAVPYVSMPPEMSTSPRERERIVAWRISFVIVGVLAGAVGAPLLVHGFGGGQRGYSRMSLILGSVCGLAMLAAFFAGAKLWRAPASIGSARLWSSLRDVTADPILGRLVAAFLAQVTAASLSSALLPYVAIRLLGRSEALIGTLFLALLLTSLPAIPIWARLAGGLGKRRAFMLAGGLAAASSLSLLALGPRYPVWLLHVQFAISGFSFAGFQYIPFAMITDVIQHAGLRRGAPCEGLYTGVWTASEKFGLALGPLLAATLLAATGYSASGGLILASSPAGLAIRLGVSLPPALLQILSVFLMIRYPLSEAELDRLRAAATLDTSPTKHPYQTEVAL